MYDFQKVRGFSWPSLASYTHAICNIFKESEVFPLRVWPLRPTRRVSFSKKNRGCSSPCLVFATHAICVLFKKSEGFPGRACFFLTPSRSVSFSKSPRVFLAVSIFFQKKGAPIFLEAFDLWARCSRLFFSRKSLDFLNPCAKAAK